MTENRPASPESHIRLTRAKYIALCHHQPDARSVVSVLEGCALHTARLIALRELYVMYQTLPPDLCQALQQSVVESEYETGMEDTHAT